MMPPSRRSRQAPRRQQRGYALLATALAIVLFSTVVLMSSRDMTRRAYERRADAEGQQAAQFAIGIRGLIARAQADPSLLPGGTQTGVGWLKPPSCGGLASNPVEGYVPCTYTGGAYGSSYQTGLTRDAATNFITARTTFMIPRLGNGPRDNIMFADNLVSNALASQSLPNSGTFFSAWANVAENATGPRNPGDTANAGRVVLLASNAPTNDAFLRTDGTNHMLANLNMGGMSIGNAADARFSGDVRVDQRVQVRDGLTATHGAVDMRAGAITTELALTSIGKYASEGIYDAQVLTGAASYNLSKPDCSQAGNSPGIYAAIQSSGTPNAGGYRGDALYGSRVDVADHGSFWQVIPVVQTARFDLGREGNDIVLTKHVDSHQAASVRILTMRRCR